MDHRVALAFSQLPVGVTPKTAPAGSTLVIRDSLPDDLPGIALLQADVDPELRLAAPQYAALWRWLCERNPTGPAKVLVGVEDNGRIVSHETLVRFPLVLDGRERIAGLTCLLVVAQSHRHGLLFTITEKAFAAGIPAVGDRHRAGGGSRPHGGTPPGPRIPRGRTAARVRAPLPAGETGPAPFGPKMGVPLGLAVSAGRRVAAAREVPQSCSRRGHRASGQVRRNSGRRSRRRMRSAREPHPPHGQPPRLAVSAISQSELPCAGRARCVGLAGLRGAASNPAA